ncbi:hypothetical protein DERF_006595 [Dermatophagoides farinae]|nr:neuropeptide-like protein 31 [Dermatophagoides farinae]KAH9515820.1 hypothetical protein DERF_006595 [Dermatophagoides farinae]
MKSFIAIVFFAVLALASAQYYGHGGYNRGLVGGYGNYGGHSGLIRASPVGYAAPAYGAHGLGLGAYGAGHRGLALGGGYPGAYGRFHG